MNGSYCIVIKLKNSRGQDTSRLSVNQHPSNTWKAVSRIRPDSKLFGLEDPDLLFHSELGNDFS